MALEQLTALKNRMEEARKQVEVEAKTAFGDTVKEIFTKHPALESFSWRQYTSYFNDGEECTFSAHTDQDFIEINGQDGYEVARQSKRVDGQWVDIPDNEFHPLYAAQKEVSSLLNVIGEEFLKAMVGDHCQVIAKRDGSVTVESYSHD